MRNLLISAYGCEPNKGSESGVGWNWVLQMAKNNKLWVITRKNNKESIEGNIPKEIEGNISFIYYDPSNFIKKLKIKDKGLYLFYFFWQLGAYLEVKKIVKKIKFDYTMHLSFGSIWMPTFIPFLGIPFIWGPIGGGEGIPDNYLSRFSLKQKLTQKFRKVLIKTILINPLTFFSCYKATSILVRTKDTYNIIPNRYKNKTKIILETGMEFNEFKNIKKIWRKNNICNIIYTGRLIQLKNLEIALKSLSKVQTKEIFKFTIIGRGSLKQNLETLCKKLNLNTSVEFVNEISRKEVLQKLSESDLYLFLSLKEGGAWSLMEAMGIGLPVICMNLSGMQIITNKECALQIEPSNYEETEEKVQEALEKLIDNPEFCSEMGKKGRERIKTEFNWEKKGEFMESLFKEIERNKGRRS